MSGNKMSLKLNKILAAVLGAVAVQTSWALPTLQLDIAGGYYVGGSEESTLSVSRVFNLEALVLSSYLSLDPAKTYYLSAAITPKTSVPLTENFGSFKINGTTYDADHGMVWGTPPVDEVQTGELATHSIYDTHYAEIAFTFAGSDLIAAYNVQDNALSPGQTINRKTFTVDASGLAKGYEVHFDLYNTKTKKGLEIVDEFAPFTHDAVSAPDAGATVALLGLALAGLGTVRSRLGRKQQISL
jgi:hypothetical protein